MPFDTDNMEMTTGPGVRRGHGVPRRTTAAARGARGARAARPQAVPAGAAAALKNVTHQLLISEAPRPALVSFPCPVPRPARYLGAARRGLETLVRRARKRDGEVAAILVAPRQS